MIFFQDNYSAALMQLQPNIHRYDKCMRTEIVSHKREKGQNWVQNSKQTKTKQTALVQVRYINDILNNLDNYTRN